MKTALKGWYSGGSEALPTDYEGLQYWYDVSQETGLVDGNTLQTITDRSGNGRNLTQSVAIGRATYKENIVNGKPILRFNGTPFYNPVNGKTDIDWMHQGDSTLFWVLYSNVDGVASTLFDSALATSANVGRTIQLQSIATITDQIYAGGGTNVVINTPINNSTPKLTWMVIVSRFEQAKVSNESTIEVNNLLKGSATQTNAVSAATAGQTPKWFGRSNDTNRFNGDVAEWFGYNRALTDDEIRLLVGGVNSSYGL